MSVQAETLEKAYSLEDFVADTRHSLKSKPGPEGVEEVRQHLEQLLRNPNPAARPSRRFTPFGTHRIHHDPETDVYVLVHGREKAGGASPHDHGPAGWSMASIRITLTCRSGNAWTTAAKKATPISRWDVR